MAKLNIELDLDYLEEGQEIDEFVRDEIINSATRKVEATIMAAAKTRLESALAKAEEIVDKKVVEITTKVIDDFVATQKFPQYKSSYDKNPEYKTIPEILIDKLETSLNKSVDKNGYPTNASYDKQGTRLDWLTGTLAEKYADEKVKESTKDIKQHIEKFVLEKVKGEIMTQLSTSILNNIDFSKIK